MPSKRPPKEILNWIFLVSSLNFSFWSDLPANERFGVIWTAGVDGKCAGEEKKCFTGYFSLLVCLHRALHERLPILDPQFWKSGSEAELRNAFRSDQAEEMPLLDERIRVLREIGSGLCSVRLKILRAPTKLLSSYSINSLTMGRTHLSSRRRTDQL